MAVKRDSSRSRTEQRENHRTISGALYCLNCKHEAVSLLDCRAEKHRRRAFIHVFILMSEFREGIIGMIPNVREVFRILIIDIY